MMLDYTLAILIALGIFSWVNAIGEGRLWNLSAREEFLKGSIAFALAAIVYFGVMR